MQPNGRVEKNGLPPQGGRGLKHLSRQQHAHRHDVSLRKEGED